MKNFRFSLLILTALIFMVNSCKEEDFSKNYDIDFPAATVVEVSDNQPFVDDEITLKGEWLNTVTSVSVGTYKFSVISTSNESMVVKVPRVIEAGNLILVNKYKREFVSQVLISPQFYPAIVKNWPTKLEKGKNFTLKGENMDLIAEVKINGTKVSLTGSPSKDQVSYSIADVDLNVGDKCTIEVVPKNGDKQESPELEVVTPSATYMPKQTIMLWDFETQATMIDITDKDIEFQYVPGFFGTALKATHPNLQSGWSPVAKIYTDNNGQGFDLTGYNNPYLTMLVNTNGKKGYVNLEIDGSIDGHSADKHMNGYQFQTQDWEWFSFDIVKMGFDGSTNDWGTAPDVRSETLKSIKLRFLDGNAAGDWEIALDQIMITDGPLNPTVAWDAENDVENYEAGVFSLLSSNSNNSLIGYSQGQKYANYKGENMGWDKNVIAVTTCAALDPITYQNGIWINFLLNTADKGGYIQPCMGAGWMNLIKSQGYGDDYQINPTNNQWQWRSIRVIPGEGDLSEWDSSNDFTFKIQILGGNYGGDMDISCDYFIFTTVPLDSNLNTDELN